MGKVVYSYFLKTEGNLNLSENFKVKEFKSRTNTTVFVDFEIVRILQGIRDYLGVPINVNSGYRTQAHNTSVGGSTNSAHLIGCAADISCKLPAIEIAKAAYKLYGKGIAIGLHTNENYVHIDTLYRGNLYAETLSNKVDKF